MQHGHYVIGDVLHDVINDVLLLLLLLTLLLCTADNKSLVTTQPGNYVYLCTIYLLYLVYLCDF